MEKAIYFDMDGTIADLYGIKDWLNKLRSYDPSPYAQARPMLNMQVLARTLNKLKKRGYHIGIISWLSRSSTPAYDKAVTAAKLSWLNKHLHSVHFDEIAIVSYGTSKAETAQKQKGILFDDEEKNRATWGGIAHDEKNILKILQKCLTML